MISTYAGPSGTCSPRGTITLDDKEAKALVDGGYAEAVEDPEAGQPVTEEAAEPKEDPDQEQPEEEKSKRRK